MKKFRCVESGAILLVNSNDIAKQFIKSNVYEEIIEKSIEEPKQGSQKKDIKDMNKKELVAYLKTLDIDANEDMKKDDLLALIPEE